MKRLFLLAIAAGLLCSQAPPALQPGPLTDGSELLPIGWRMKAAGTQVKVGTFPTSSALSVDGRFLVVLNAGSPASINVIRTDTLAVLSTTPVADAWQGVTFSPDGRNLYTSGGPRNSVFEFTFSPEGALALAKEMPGAAAGGFIGDLAIPSGGRLVYAADLFHDEILVFNPQSGRVIERHKSARRPYQILFHPDGRSYFVSSWAEGSVIQYRTSTGEEIGRIRVAPHPTGMVLSDRKIPDDETAPPMRLFVAAANTNNVFAIGIDRSDVMKQVDILNIGFSPGQPAGMTPTALTLSKDQTRLFVACSNVNAIAVADISESRSRLAGFIPVGAYPAALRLLPDSRLASLNMHNATISVVPPLTAASLAALTAQAVELVAYDPAEAVPAAPPVENVIYVTTATRGANFEKLSKEFTSVTHFIPNAAGAEGLQWSLAGVPSDFAQRLRGKGFSPTDITNQPPAGTLLTNARQAGLTTGEFGPALPETLPATLPRLTVIRLAGADADKYLGQIADTLAKSPAWNKTAIFVVGESAPLLIVSPYTRRAAPVSGMFYNHSSVLRTMELILKLRPMTIFDASSRPLTDLFSRTIEAQ
ncbi:MAG: bifunctional YncE family protein/alkaline phosphatase family protein [Bryobacteraceae bacterium]